MSRRRRPLILLGLPIICHGVVCVCSHEEAGLVWLFCGLFAIYFGFTLIDLPYVSWGAEMSNDYDERSRVAAWRGGFGSVGTLVALSIPLILQLFGEPTTGDMLFWMAVFFVTTQPIAFGIMMLKLPEPVPEEITGKRTPLLEGFKIVARNRPFFRLLIAPVSPSADGYRRYTESHYAYACRKGTGGFSHHHIRAEHCPSTWHSNLDMVAEELESIGPWQSLQSLSPYAWPERFSSAKARK